MKDNCADDESLSAYVDGELDAAAERLMEAHLAVCHRCAGKHEALRQLRGLFAPFRDEWSPINVVDGVMAQIGECSCGWGWRRLAMVPLVLLSFAALLVGIQLGSQLAKPHQVETAAAMRLAPFAAIPPGNLCIGDASCQLEGNI